MWDRIGRIAIVAMVVVALGACKQDQPTSEPGAAASHEPVKVSFWYAYGGNNRKVTETLIERFNRSHPDIEIVGTYQGDYFEALAKLRIASRTTRGPVVTHVIGEAIPSLYGDGVLANLDDFASGKSGALPLQTDDFIPALTQEGYFDTGSQKVPLVALPFNRSTPIAYYNVRMFKEAGVSPPKTWQELVEVSKRLTVRDGDDTKVWGFELPVDWWFWFGMLHQAGGSLLTADGKHAAFQQEPGIRALELLVRLVKEDKVMKNPPGRDFNAWEVANNDFLNEKVAMIWTSTAFLRYFSDHAKFEVGTAFLPGDKKRAVPTGGTFFVVMDKKSAAEKLAGWTFVRWMTEPEQTAYWSKATGYMPVRRSALESPELKSFYAKNPNYQTSIDQLEVAVKFPFSPKLLELQRSVLQPSLERPVVTDADAKSVLTKAGVAADKLLSR